MSMLVAMTPISYLGLSDGRQRRIEVRTQEDVVETDHGEIVRDHHVQRLRGTDRPDRHKVIRGEDGGRRLSPGEQVHGRLMSALAAKVAFDDPVVLNRDAGFLHGFAIAEHALLRRLENQRTADAGDVAVADLDQVIYGRPCARRVIRYHCICADLADGAVHNHNRHVFPPELHGPVRRSHPRRRR